jgi:hypothetical protein
MPFVKELSQRSSVSVALVTLTKFKEFKLRDPNIRPLTMNLHPDPK